MKKRGKVKGFKKHKPEHHKVRHLIHKPEHKTEHKDIVTHGVLPHHKELDKIIHHEPREAHHKKLKKGWFAEREQHKLAAQGVKVRKKEYAKYKGIYIALAVVSLAFGAFAFLKEDYLSFGLAAAAFILAVVLFILIVTKKEKIEFARYLTIWGVALILSVFSITKNNFLALTVLLITMFFTSLVAMMLAKKLMKDKIILAVRQLSREKKTNETDIDHLYELIKRLKKLRISEIALAFGIDIKKAEEWAKILEEHDLAVIYYPPLGEAELKYKDKIKTEEKEKL